MNKIIKNNTVNDIQLKILGLTIPASSQITLDVTDYLILSNSESVSELSSLISSSSITINDGTQDLTIDRAIDFIKYPDKAFSIKFLSEPERSNGLESKNVQQAIEELKMFLLSTTSIVYESSGTSSISRTATSFANMSGLSLEPVPGKYLVILNANIGTTGVNTEAEYTIAINGTPISLATRSIRNTANILGLVTLSTNNSAGGHTSAVVLNINEGDVITAQYRHISGGSIVVTNRTLTAVRVYSEGEISATLPITSNLHGSLAGLLNDDHPQYLPLTGIRAMLGSLDMNNFHINNVTNINGQNFNALVTEAYTPNFSYRTINKNIKIPIEQQMVVYQEFYVDANFELTIEGEVVIL